MIMDCVCYVEQLQLMYTMSFIEVTAEKTNQVIVYVCVEGVTKTHTAKTNMSRQKKYKDGYYNI